MSYLQNKLDDQREFVEANDNGHPWIEKARTQLTIAQEMLDTGAVATSGGNKPTRVAWSSLLSFAYHLVLMAHNDLVVKRDHARQRGTKKVRRPDINNWIDKELERDPTAKSPTLWNQAPEFITDQIGDHAFKKRVTAARKRKSAGSN